MSLNIVLFSCRQNTKNLRRQKNYQDSRIKENVLLEDITLLKESLSISILHTCINVLRLDNLELWMLLILSPGILDEIENYNEKRPPGEPEMVTICKAFLN